MPQPPYPPPNRQRPFNWRVDAPEWGEEGWDPDKAGCLFVLASLVCLLVGFFLLYVSVWP